MGEKSDPVKRTRSRKAASSGSDDTVLGTDRVSSGIPDIDSVSSLGDDDLVVSEAGESKAGTTPDSTEQIREEIEETRAQMSGTIDEIQERLSPRRLVNEAKETVRDATVGKVRDVMDSASTSAGGMVDRIKDNPVPAALIGIGAWWLFSQRNAGQRNVSGYSGQRSYTGQANYTGETNYTGQANDDASNFQQGYLGPQRSSGGFVNTLKQHPVPAALAGLGMAWWMRDRRQGRESSYLDDSEWNSDYSSYRASNWRGTQGSGSSGIRDAASSATDTVSEYTERAQEKVSDLAERTQETVGEYADRAQTEFDRLLRDNPLALGAFAVAVGAAVGMAIPETQRERQMMGDVRNQIVDKAQNLAQGAVDKVQQVASNLPGGGGDRSSNPGAGGGRAAGNSAAGGGGDRSFNSPGGGADRSFNSPGSPGERSFNPSGSGGGERS